MPKCIKKLPLFSLGPELDTFLSLCLSYLEFLLVSPDKKRIKLKANVTRLMGH